MTEYNSVAKATTTGQPLPNGQYLPAGTHVGQVRLQVSDLASALAFYEGLLGFRQASRNGHSAALSATGQPPHAIVLVEQPGAPPKPPRTTGLYHVAIRLPTRRALAEYLEMRGEFALPDAHGASDSFLAYADWLRTYAWIDLDPIDTGPRAAYPYEWWFDERQGDAADEWSVGNNVPSVNTWLLLGADAMAYAYRLSGEADYLERAAALFRAGSRDPWFEGDPNIYAESKETVNSITFGHLFLHEWAGEQ